MFVAPFVSGHTFKLRYEFLTVVNIKITIFWYVKKCTNILDEYAVSR
jgi:hypothetical protein